jgi:SAM-dependent methyltransferase
VLRLEPYTLLRCSGCGLIRTDGGGDPSARYDETYYSAHALADTLRGLNSTASGRSRLVDLAYATYLDRGSSLFRRFAFLPVRNRLGGLPPPELAGGNLLDVGSGDGDFLRRIRAHGYRAVGQEINPSAVASAQAAGLPVRLGDLDEVGFAPASFDVLRLWHVLEHVPDPLGTLAKARKFLRSGGLLIVGVPDFASPARQLFGTRWAGLQLPYHRHHFTAATLRRTLAAAGFRIRRVRHRSVGTMFSSLVGSRRMPAIVGHLAWASLVLVDDLLDLTGRGDTIEILAASLGVDKTPSTASGLPSTRTR